MAVCEIPELISGCYHGLSPATANAVELALLCSIQNNLLSGTPMSCDVQTLMDDAACFYGLSDSMSQALRLSLLCNIGVAIAAGGGGGGYLPLSGSGHPEGVATGVIVGQTYFRTDTGELYLFNGTPGNNTGWTP